ncbi:MAG: L,D-transpeptidase family protein [Chitinophagales bacterium]
MEFQLSWIAWVSIFVLTTGGARAQLNGDSGKVHLKTGISSRLYDQDLVARFYQLNQQELFWFQPSKPSSSIRQTLLCAIDSSEICGLNKNDYHYSDLNVLMNQSFSVADSLQAKEADRVFTDAAIRLCRDLYCGKGIASWISADGISNKFLDKDNLHILQGILASTSPIKFSEFLHSLEPGNKEYGFLASELRDRLQSNDSTALRRLVPAINHYRWINHFHLGQFIIVNVPGATLSYYDRDTLRLKMKTVLGKPSTPTPRFAAYCNQIILYPYWNVPRKIAVNELLPMFKLNPSLVDSMNMQVVDKQGKILDPLKIKWSKYNKENFPYLIRQSTGCDNALGVVKFNLTSPYDVYMHDTNFKPAFLSDFPYYSHGCIRLELPIALANFILRNRIDPTFLESCLKNQSPVNMQLDQPVPVFVVYMLAGTDETGKVSYFRDVYRLLK